MKGETRLKGIKNMRTFRIFLRGGMGLWLTAALLSASAITAASTETPVSVSPKAPPASPASEQQVRTLKAAASLFGEAEDEILERKNWTDVQVTDALVALHPVVMKIDPKALKPGDEEYDRKVMEDLLALVGDKKAALRSRNLSAWTLEKHLQKIVAALTQEEVVAAEVKKAEAVKDGKSTAVEKVAEAEKETSSDGLKEVRSSLDRVQTDVKELRVTESRLKEVEREAEADRVKVSGVQDDLSLIRDNLDALQENLKGIGGRLDEIEKKVGEKGLDTDDQKREWTLMRKDIRDHSQDLSVLKQKVENLMAPEKKTASSMDRVISSKWLPGGALLISLAAVVIAASK